MKKLLVIILGILFSANTFSAVATHGMVLFGEETIYAYHLPMFHKIHAKQVVLKLAPSLELKNQIGNLVKTQLVTFVPDPFDLDAFLKQPHSLVGDVYAGHFEKDGVVVISHVEIPVELIVYQNDIFHDDSNNNFLKYLVVSDMGNGFLIHLLQKDPEVDQIFALKGKVEVSPYGMAGTVHGEGLLQENTPMKMTVEKIPCVTRACPIFFEKTFEIGKKIFEDTVM